jgi:hypothetical protein
MWNNIAKNFQTTKKACFSTGPSHLSLRLEKLISLTGMETAHTYFHTNRLSPNRDLHLFEIGLPASSRLSMRMGDIIAIHRTFATNITPTSHSFPPFL